MGNKEITVLDQAIRINKDDYFSLTDIARYKNADAPADVVKNGSEERIRSSLSVYGSY